MLGRRGVVGLMWPVRTNMLRVANTDNQLRLPTSTANTDNQSSERDLRKQQVPISTLRPPGRASRRVKQRVKASDEAKSGMGPQTRIMARTALGFEDVVAEVEQLRLAKIATGSAWSM